MDAMKPAESPIRLLPLSSDGRNGSGDEDQPVTPDDVVRELTRLARRVNPQLDAECALHELRNDLREALAGVNRLEAVAEKLAANLEARSQVAADPAADHAQITALADTLHDAREQAQRKTKALWDLTRSVCDALRELEGFASRGDAGRCGDFEPLWENLLGHFENQGIFRIAPKPDDPANPENHQTEDGRAATGKIRKTLRTGFRSTSEVLLKAIVVCKL